MNGGTFFNRAYAITVAAPGATNGLQYGNIANGDYNETAPLHVQFEVVKTSDGTPNKGSVTLFNLNPGTRGSITAGARVQVVAGYQDLYEVLSIGTVGKDDKVESARSGPDIATKIEFAEGADAITFARFRATYPAKTHLVSILNDIASTMRQKTDLMPNGVSAGVYLGIPDLTLSSRAFDGTCAHALDKLLKPLGMEWNVQNGKLNILPKTAHLGQEAVVLSPTSGLIGVPSLNMDAVTCSALLNPKLRPGALFQLDSQENPVLNGYYKVRKSTFKGDSAGGDWDVTVEGVRINGVQNVAESYGGNLQQAVEVA